MFRYAQTYHCCSHVERTVIIELLPMMPARICFGSTNGLYLLRSQSFMRAHRVHDPSLLLAPIKSLTELRPLQPLSAKIRVDKPKDSPEPPATVTVQKFLERSSNTHLRQIAAYA